MKPEAPRPVHLKDYRPPAYLIDTVDLDIALHATRTSVRAKLHVRPNPAAGAKPGSLVLDGEGLDLEEVRVAGETLPPGAYQVEPGSLTLPQVPAGAFELQLVTTCNPEDNKALQGLYLSRGVYCTQCEAQGFRRITYFLDRPDVLATFTTRIEF